MPLVTYVQTTQEKTVAKVRARYKTGIDLLKQMGFEELFFYGERQPSFSAIWFSPVLLMMLSKNEVLEITSPLRTTAHYPILVSREYATYALVFGLGTKFYTTFTDETGLVSANSGTHPRYITDKEKYHKYNDPSRDVESTWEFHRQKVDEFRAEGKQTKDDVCFEGYVEISRREDKVLPRELTATKTGRRKRGTLDILLALGIIPMIMIFECIGFLFLLLLWNHLELWFIATSLLTSILLLIDFVLAGWDVFKGNSFELLYAPPNARVVKIIKNILFVLAAVLVFAAGELDPLPATFSRIAFFAWFLFSVCLSIFYRLKEFRVNSKVDDQIN